LRALLKGVILLEYKYKYSLYIQKEAFLTTE